MGKLYGKLNVRIFQDRGEMGRAAALDAFERISALLVEKDTVRLIFAAAPSQNEFLAALAEKDIDWTRIEAFHLDEYIGLDADAPQGFGNFLRRAIFDRVSFMKVNFLNGQAAPETACAEYTALLAGTEIDIAFLGVGENGHLAFNDPPVADFGDPEVIKAVPLDQICRRQQVNDGCFAKLEDVPTHALTLTIPTLMNCKQLITVVPGKLKANAVKAMLDGPLTTDCPASILKNHPNAVLYLDADSAMLLSDSAGLL